MSEWKLNLTNFQSVGNTRKDIHKALEGGETNSKQWAPECNNRGSCDPASKAGHWRLKIATGAVQTLRHVRLAPHELLHLLFLFCLFLTYRLRVLAKKCCLFLFCEEFVLDWLTRSCWWFWRWWRLGRGGGFDLHLAQLFLLAFQITCCILSQCFCQ